MAMQPCNKCLENNWKFIYEEGLVTATCQNCGNEITFPVKRKRSVTIEKEENKRCRKCGGLIIVKESKFKSKKLKKAYYYTHILFCSSCKTMYHNNKYRIIN